MVASDQTLTLFTVPEARQHFTLQMVLASSICWVRAVQLLHDQLGMLACSTHVGEALWVCGFTLL